jgi:hypothetical protein
MEICELVMNHTDRELAPGVTHIHNNQGASFFIKNSWDKQKIPELLEFSFGII